MISEELLKKGIESFGSKGRFFLWLISEIETLGKKAPIEHKEEEILTILSMYSITAKN